MCSYQNTVLFANPNEKMSDREMLEYFNRYLVERGIQSGRITENYACIMCKCKYKKINIGYAVWRQYFLKEMGLTQKRVDIYNYSPLWKILLGLHSKDSNTTVIHDFIIEIKPFFGAEQIWMTPEEFRKQYSKKVNVR